MALWLSLAFLGGVGTALSRLSRQDRAIIFSSSLLLLSLGYLGAVGYEIKENEKYRVINREFLDEAERIRARASGDIKYQQI